MAAEESVEAAEVVFACAGGVGADHGEVSSMIFGLVSGAPCTCTAGQFADRRTVACSHAAAILPLVVQSSEVLAS